MLQKLSIIRKVLYIEVIKSIRSIYIYLSVSLKMSVEEFKWSIIDTFHCICYMDIRL